MYGRSICKLGLTKLSASFCYFFCVFFLPSTITHADESPKLWTWTKDADHLLSVVRIDIDGAQATGVVAKLNENETKANGIECYILTAYHVVEECKEEKAIQITYHTGDRIRECKIIAFDAQHDVALLKTWAPKEVDAAIPATDSVGDKMYVEFAGLGGSAELDALRHFSSRATQPTNGQFIYADETLLPGDSGGPVFNRSKKLVGIISGGWFWWDAGIKSDAGVPILSTWPARASNLDVIQELLKKAEQKPISSEVLADN